MRLPGLKVWLYVSIAFLILLLGVAGGMALNRFEMNAISSSDGQLNYQLISEALNLIHRHYVDRAAEKPRRMTYGAISGIVDSLGDTGHTRFLSPQMVKELSQLEQNKFQGIGAEVQMKGGHVTIVAPLDGSPAQRAGLRAGDLILRVNGRQISGLPLDQVSQLISGPAGTKVTLTIFRPSSNRTKQLTITRAHITVQDVTWQMLPGTKVADLRIANFGKGASSQLRHALTSIKRAHAKAMILDLRDNPGGILKEAVNCASQFLNGGNVLLVKNAKGVEKAVRVKAGGEATEIPLAVLVNGGTASAAEIVAGALQDRHRAQLVGETTFGTGTVLQEFKLPHGAALLLAVEEWLTPDGHVIWHKGIKPNVVVSLLPQASLLSPLGLRTMTAQQLRHSSDAQLLRALQSLQQAASAGGPATGIRRRAGAHGAALRTAPQT